MRVPTPTARSTSTSSAASPSTASATRTRRSSRRVTDAVVTLGHVSNLYASEPAIELAERLLAHFGAPGRVFFCNSGTEANEAAFKIARLTGRSKIIAAKSPSTAARWVRSRSPARPPSARRSSRCPPGVVHVPYGDADALDAAVDADTAAVFLEPMMGESGVVVPPEGLPRRGPRDHRRARRPAGARRGADRDRPHGLVLRTPGGRASCPTS